MLCSIQADFYVEFQNLYFNEFTYSCAGLASDPRTCASSHKWGMSCLRLCDLRNINSQPIGSPEMRQQASFLNLCDLSL